MSSVPASGQGGGAATSTAAPLLPAAQPSQPRRRHARLRGKGESFGKRFAQSRWRGWWMQLGATILSILCVLAIVAVLLSIADKPLQTSQFLTVSVTPNTLIAILSTISSSTTLFAVGDCLGQLKWAHFRWRPHRLEDLQTFDDASRGPLGSLALLIKINVHAVVACLGALITIAALVSGPFAQELIHYDNELRPAHNGTASIPRTKQYLANDTFASYKTSFSNTTSLEDLFLESLYNPGFEVDTSCDTQECTWDAFQSLAFCSDCIDITSTLHRQCDLDQDQLELNCTWTTPSGSVFSNNFSIIYPVLLMSNYTVLGNATPIGGSQIIPSAANEGQIRLSAEFLQFLDRYSPLSNDWSQIPQVITVVATQCSLSFCMKTYKPTYAQGQLDDAVVNETALHFSANGAYGVLPPGGTVYLWPGTTAESFGNDFDAAGAYHDNQSGIFWINAAGLDDFAATFDASLTFSILSSQFVGAPESSDPTGMDLAGYNEGNISLTFAGIAAGMSNGLRMQPGNTPVSGVALASQVIVRVRWWWFTFPAAVSLLTAVFVVYAIFFSIKRGDVAWKSSSLALLFHGLSGWTEDELNVQSLEEMEKLAKEMTVSLEQGAEGPLAFVRSKN